MLSARINTAVTVAQPTQQLQTDKIVVQREGAAEFVERKRNHTARIIFETKLFDARKHKIGRTRDCITIDGRVPLGTDCNIPQIEIASMRFFFDGNEIQIPKKLYSDCYTPPYFKDYKRRGWIDKYLQIKFSDDFTHVFVFLSAGDGAGVYDVIWVLSKDGRHTRFTHSGGDCGFLNWDCTPKL